MKNLSQFPEDMYYLATDRVMLHVKEPYRIQKEMIEMKNFVPEAFMIHQFQEYKNLEMECYDCIRAPKTAGAFPAPDLNSFVDADPFRLAPDDDDEDDDWDDEDEDWDEEGEDEDWDEEDEDWDEEDEDEDWDEEDEDWDDEDVDDDEGE